MAHLYEKLECIGKGSFGEVYKGLEVATNKVVALKLVDLEKADEEIDVIQREIKVMSQILNPYVVQYYSSLMNGSTLWIVMEYMGCGSLKELLDSVGPFPEDAIATVMKALFKGLDYVHKGNKLHRDIKAANILLSNQGEVKLADFGVAGQMTGTVRQRNTFVGSPFWMAPEVIQASLYDEKADIWSAGITGMELANGLPPYATEHPYRALFLIPKNDPPRLDGPHFSKSCKDFISLCLKKNPAERPSAEQLLTHSFLKKARTASVKELLRRKERVSGEDDSGTVVIGGDSDSGSQDGTFRVQKSSGDGTIIEAQEKTSMWEFDFGSLSESQVDVHLKKDVPANDLRPDDESRRVDESNGYEAHQDVKGDTARRVEMVVAENMVTEATVADANTVADSQSVKTEDPASKSAESETHVAPESVVLSDLILPVISQIRADVDTCGGSNDALMTTLGALEVAFVDAESAKPGVTTLLFESLLSEGLRSPSPVIRAMLMRALQNPGRGS